jgi:hypothetical protein
LKRLTKPGRKTPKVIKFKPELVTKSFSKCRISKDCKQQGHECDMGICVKKCGPKPKYSCPEGFGCNTRTGYCHVKCENDIDCEEVYPKYEYCHGGGDGLCHDKPWTVTLKLTPEEQKKPAEQKAPAVSTEKKAVATGTLSDPVNMVRLYYIDDNGKDDVSIFDPETKRWGSGTVNDPGNEAGDSYYKEGLRKIAKQVYDDCSDEKFDDECYVEINCGYASKKLTGEDIDKSSTDHYTTTLNTINTAIKNTCNKATSLTRDFKDPRKAVNIDISGQLEATFNTATRWDGDGSPSSGDSYKIGLLDIAEDVRNQCSEFSWDSENGFCYIDLGSRCTASSPKLVASEIALHNQKKESLAALMDKKVEECGWK